MNITQQIKWICLAGICLFGLAEKGFTKEPGETARLAKLHRWELTIGGGYSAHIASEPEKSYLKGFVPVLSTYWVPDHTLDLGFEVTRLPVKAVSKNFKSTEFGETRFRARLDALPLILAFRKRIGGFFVKGGAGVALVESRVSAYNHSVNVQKVHYSYLGGLGYRLHVHSKIQAGITAHIYVIPEMKKQQATFSFNITYALLQW